MKLLYVEDNPFDRDLTRRTLLKQIPDLEWDTAAGVQEAIGKLAGQHYDLLLLDMWLQDGCGLDVLLHVRRKQLGMAVVVVAGAGDEASVVQFLKAGAQDYVPKRGKYLEQLGEHLLRALDRVRQNIRPSTVLTVLYVESNQDDIDLTRRHFERRAPHLNLVVHADGPSLRWPGWPSPITMPMWRCWICACPACRAWNCWRPFRPATSFPAFSSPVAAMKRRRRRP